MLVERRIKPTMPESQMKKYTFVGGDNVCAILVCPDA